MCIIIYTMIGMAHLEQCARQIISKVFTNKSLSVIQFRIQFIQQHCVLMLEKQGVEKTSFGSRQVTLRQDDFYTCVSSSLHISRQNGVPFTLFVHIIKKVVYILIMRRYGRRCLSEVAGNPYGVNSRQRRSPSRKSSTPNLAA